MDKPSILVVEDEIIIRQMLVNQLKKLDCNVIADVSSGEEAVEIANFPDKIDLICMDINLSGSIDGIEAAEIISSQRDVPILFLTAYELPVSIDKKISNYGYIGKPIPMEKLRDFIFDIKG
ncbi:MAG: response regulator [Spirochaetes bacterium]|nr:response regulator [Spirochaetota bacterium]MBN2769947.1 response regulator [Spirochaetota bacterium]HRX15518.1 response regulator [Spirochaetota bacterium]